MTWLLLLIVALFTVLFPLLDIVGTARGGLPSDHTAACQALAGHSFPGIQPTGPTRYIRQLEYGYALHELAFALFFLVIVAIPVRAGQRWAWLACWLILIPTTGYTLTFAHYSSKTPASLKHQHTLATAVARYDQLRPCDILAPGAEELPADEQPQPGPPSRADRERWGRNGARNFGPSGSPRGCCPGSRGDDASPVVVPGLTLLRPPTPPAAS